VEAAENVGPGGTLRSQGAGTFSGGSSRQFWKAQEAYDRLRERLGEGPARDRLAEFGPRAAVFAGRFHLADMDMPPYEWAAQYRPGIFSDRLYDLKIAVARRVEQAGLPAAILPLVLPLALEEMLAKLNMAFPYDWTSVVRVAQDVELDRLLDRAARAGTLVPWSPPAETRKATP
jgi:hypothetical protein